MVQISTSADCMQIKDSKQHIFSHFISSNQSWIFLMQGDTYCTHLKVKTDADVFYKTSCSENAGKNNPLGTQYLILEGRSRRWICDKYISSTLHWGLDSVIYVLNDSHEANTMKSLIFDVICDTRIFNYLLVFWKFMNIPISHPLTLYRKMEITFRDMIPPFWLNVDLENQFRS